MLVHFVSHQSRVRSERTLLEHALKYTFGLMFFNNPLFQNQSGAERSFLQWFLISSSFAAKQI